MERCIKVDTDSISPTQSGSDDQAGCPNSTVASEKTEILYPCGCCCERCYHRRADDGNCLFHIYAPELYEALKDMLDALDHTLFSGGRQFGRTYLNEKCEQAQALIAKIDGSEN